jgi:hypothetical protein
MLCALPQAAPPRAVWAAAGGCAWAVTGEKRKKKSDGWKEVEAEGKTDISPSFFSPVRLQMDLIRRFVYIMASFKQVESCSGTDTVN